MQTNPAEDMNEVAAAWNAGEVHSTLDRLIDFPNTAAPTPAAA